MTGAARPLDGCTVVVTRERPGELGRLLTDAGATVDHVPLIEVVDPIDRRPLGDALARLEEFDWLMVTSAAGAERVGATAQHADVRLAAVGTATARRLSDLAGRPVDLVPSRQLAAELAAEFDRSGHAPARILVAQADRASSVLGESLRAAGNDVTEVVVYRTRLREPTDDERRRIATADAMLLASGSAATSLMGSLGQGAPSALPPIVVAIGPSTADAAVRSGLKVTSIAADHSLDGLVNELTTRWRTASGS